MNVSINEPALDLSLEVQSFGNTKTTWKAFRAE